MGQVVALFYYILIKLFIILIMYEVYTDAQFSAVNPLLVQSAGHP